jgi:hypothetical protein
MIFKLILLLLCSSISFAFAQGNSNLKTSLHLQPIGTLVERYFSIAGKFVPLPEGRFTLVLAREYSANPRDPLSRVPPSELAQVMLFQSVGEKLGVFVSATANIGKTTTAWSDEPCKRSDTLFRLDREKSFNMRGDCVMVNHLTGYFSNPSGVWSDVYGQLRSRGVIFPVPAPTVIAAAITRFEQREYLAVTYTVNPEVAGFGPDSGKNWTTSNWHVTRVAEDAAKVNYVKNITDWVVSLNRLVEDGFHGKDVFSSGGTVPLLRILAKQAPSEAPTFPVAPSQPAVTGSTALPPTIEDRLRELKRLFDADLITRDVYVERQRSLLESK